MRLNTTFCLDFDVSLNSQKIKWRLSDGLSSYTVSNTDSKVPDFKDPNNVLGYSVFKWRALQQRTTSQLFIARAVDFCTGMYHPTFQYWTFQKITEKQHFYDEMLNFRFLWDFQKNALYLSTLIQPLKYCHQESKSKQGRQRRLFLVYSGNQPELSAELHLLRVFFRYLTFAFIVDKDSFSRLIWS